METAPTSSAVELRQQAISRLGQIAGYDERLDVSGTLWRKQAVEVLIRQAMRAARADELLLDEIRSLAEIARGRAWALDDALHATGLPEPTPAASTTTLEEFERAIGEELKA